VALTMRRRGIDAADLAPTWRGAGVYKEGEERHSFISCDTKMLADLPSDMLALVLDQSTPATRAALACVSTAFRHVRALTPVQREFMDMWEACAAIDTLKTDSGDDAWARRLAVARSHRKRRNGVSIRTTATKYYGATVTSPSGCVRRIPATRPGELDARYRVLMTKAADGVRATVSFSEARKSQPTIRVDLSHSLSDTRASFIRDLHSKEFSCTVDSPSPEDLEQFMADLQRTALPDACVPFVSRVYDLNVYLSYHTTAAMRLAGAPEQQIQALARKVQVDGLAAWRQAFVRPS
jgi:hypothetical protein